MNHSHERRRILVWMGATALTPLAATPALADDRPATPSMTEGPFYPRRFPKDTDSDLTLVDGHSKRASGTPLQLTGRVVDRTGRPHAGARIEIWQCDSLGTYHHVGEPESSQDPDFQGFGALTADGEGRYAFRTIKPVPYPGRTAHIHFTVLEGGKRKLTSQIFIEGEAGNERDELYRYLGSDAKRVTMKLSGTGEVLAGAFEIVLD